VEKNRRLVALLVANSISKHNINRYKLQSLCYYNRELLVLKPEIKGAALQPISSTNIDTNLEDAAKL